MILKYSSLRAIPNLNIAVIAISNRILCVQMPRLMKGHKEKKASIL